MDDSAAINQEISISINIYINGHSKPYAVLEVFVVNPALPAPIHARVPPNRNHENPRFHHYLTNLQKYLLNWINKLKAGGSAIYCGVVFFIFCTFHLL